MTNDEKERDAAIEFFTNEGYRQRAIDLWNASRKHRDAEIEALKEALEHYADKGNWDKSTRIGTFTDWYIGHGDGYEVAEKALEQLREGTK